MVEKLNINLDWFVNRLIYLVLVDTQLRTIHKLPNIVKAVNMPITIRCQYPQ